MDPSIHIVAGKSNNLIGAKSFEGFDRTLERLQTKTDMLLERLKPFGILSPDEVEYHSVEPGHEFVSLRRTDQDEAIGHPQHLAEQFRADLRGDMFIHV